MFQISVSTLQYQTLQAMPSVQRTSTAHNSQCWELWPGKYRRCAGEVMISTMEKSVPWMMNILPVTLFAVTTHEACLLFTAFFTHKVFFTELFSSNISPSQTLIRRETEENIDRVHTEWIIINTSCILTCMLGISLISGLVLSACYNC